MRVRAFAGRHAPRRTGGEWGGRLVAALAPDGPATAVALGALEVATAVAPHSAGGPALVVCVFSGRPRVQALAAELGLPPGAPAGEVIAAAHRRLGAALVERLRGAFALVVWDRERQSGLLARDPVGAEPLFVAASGGTLLFASEVRNLLRLLPARPAPDEVAMANFLARRSARGRRTLYEGIEALPPGHLIELGPDGRRDRRCWRPAYAAPDPVAPDAAAATLRAGVTGAVERALEGARRPAVMLSGGLDSSTVTAAAIAAGASPAAYSTVFPDRPEVDESPRIARVVEWLGLRAVAAEFGGGSALAAGAEFVSTWQVPSVTPNLFVWLPLLRRAAADGVDVVLDGEGGDELLGCARFLVADRLLGRGPVAAARTARRLPGMGASPRARWIRRALVAYGLRGVVPYGLHERVRRRPPPPAWLADAAAARLADDRWAWKRGRGPRWWRHMADTLTDAAEALGAADQLRREGALAGIELRHPLRDPELIELVLRLPPELAFDPLVDRPLARRAWTGALPPEILSDDAKPVYNSLPNAALAGRDLGPLRRLLGDLRPELARALRSAELDRLIERGASGPDATWALDVWRPAALQLWLIHQADPSALERLRDEIEQRAVVP